MVAEEWSCFKATNPLAGTKNGRNLFLHTRRTPRPSACGKKEKDKSRDIKGNVLCCFLFISSRQPRNTFKISRTRANARVLCSSPIRGERPSILLLLLNSSTVRSHLEERKVWIAQPCAQIFLYEVHVIRICYVWFWQYFNAENFHLAILNNFDKIMMQFFMRSLNVCLYF